MHSYSLKALMASNVVGYGFASWPGHTGDHHKNGTNCASLANRY